MSIQAWYSRRERGLPPRFGDFDTIQRNIYQAMNVAYSSYDLISSPWMMGQSGYGAIYTMQFSPDGSMLIAGCEKKCLVMFDTQNHKKIKEVTNVHGAGVNSVKFLDEYTLATCSDDKLVRLWDTRNMRDKVRTLRGHQGCVKGIDFAKRDGLLISSGFDGLVYAWDLKSVTEQGCLSRRLMEVPGMISTCLSPDENRLLISTTGGYMLLVNNVNLSMLAADFEAFIPDMFRLMQLQQQYIPFAARRLGRLWVKRNVISLLTDFPPGDKADLIPSLSIHPRSWCALSRNITSDNNAEWTTVHDIRNLSWSREACAADEQASRQSGRTSPDLDVVLETMQFGAAAYEPASAGRAPSDDDEPAPAAAPPVPPAAAPSAPCNGGQGGAGGGAGGAPVAAADERVPPSTSSSSPRGGRGGRCRCRNHFGPDTVAGSSRAASGAPAPRPAVTVQREPRAGPSRGGASAAQVSFHNYRFLLTPGLPYDRGGASVDMLMQRIPGQPARRAPVEQVEARVPVTRPDLWTSGMTVRERNAAVGGGRVRGVVRGVVSGVSPTGHGPPQPVSRRPLSPRLAKNDPRLLFHIEEAYHLPGLIIESAFSPDGRVICSPFRGGVRLLAFDQQCSEPHFVTDGTSRPLEVVKFIGPNPRLVVCSKFSPRTPLLVTGCIRGEILFQMPVL